MAVVPGWTVIRQGDQSADLVNGDENAGLFVDAGRANTSDIRQESTMAINQNIQSEGLTNVEQTPAQPQTVQGKNFQEILEVDYTADVQTDQGTMQVYGAWVTLYSASTRQAGFINLFAPSQDAFDASLQEAAAMMVSME